MLFKKKKLCIYKQNIHTFKSCIIWEALLIENLLGGEKEEERNKKNHTGHISKLSRSSVRPTGPYTEQANTSQKTDTHKAPANSRNTPTHPQGPKANSNWSIGSRPPPAQSSTLLQNHGQQHQRPIFLLNLRHPNLLWKRPSYPMASVWCLTTLSHCVSVLLICFLFFGLSMSCLGYLFVWL